MASNFKYKDFKDSITLMRYTYNFANITFLVGPYIQ